jgi:hypothetical protein
LTHYEERVNRSPSYAEWDQNNKKCGACQNCIDSAVGEQRRQWGIERTRIQNQKEDTREYLDDQLIPW